MLEDSRGSLRGGKETETANFSQTGRMWGARAEVKFVFERPGAGEMMQGLGHTHSKKKRSEKKEERELQ